MQYYTTADTSHFIVIVAQLQNCIFVHNAEKRFAICVTLAKQGGVVV